MRYLFFKIVGQPDVDMCRVVYGGSFININITQLHKPTTSQFNDLLTIGYDKTMTSFKEFHNPRNKHNNSDNLQNYMVSQKSKPLLHFQITSINMTPCQ